MATQNTSRIQSYADLLKIEDANFRVHSSVYTDPTIFKAEIAKIFEKSWVYIGHESEISNPGDYKTTMIGERPVILTRGKDHSINVLLNVCRHRANAVCREQRGNSSNFRCPYHAWTYENDGRLIGVPDRSRYPAGFLSQDLNLISVAKVGAYRGLIFATLSPEAIDLDDHLGSIKVHIDYWADRSLSDEHQVLLPHQYAYTGNWKFQCENGVDGYHPGIVHESAFSTFGEFGIGAFASRDLIKQGSITRGFEGGHSTLEGGFSDGRGSGRGNPQKFQEYYEALKVKHGDDRAAEIISNRHLFIFPNVFLFDELIRVIQPVSLEYTEVTSHPFRLSGVSDELNTRRLYEATRQLSTTGMVNPGDLEMFAANQTGLHSKMEWLVLNRGVGKEDSGSTGEAVGHYSDEVPQRSFYKHWLLKMSESEGVSV